MILMIQIHASRIMCMMTSFLAIKSVHLLPFSEQFEEFKIFDFK